MIYQQLINGLMLGASYALVAIGYTLIFGVLNLLYFAHGEIFMVGAFVGLFLVVYAGANIYGALAGAMVACAVIGVLSVFVAIRPVPKDRPLAPLISTIGLTIVLQNLAVYFIGGQQLAFPETIRQTLYHVGPVTVSSTQIFILGVAIGLMVLLWLFIEHTKMGRGIRAVAENHETAALLGVNVNRIILVTFIIGSGIAGIAGVLDGIKNSSISDGDDNIALGGRGSSDITITNCTFGTGHGLSIGSFTGGGLDGLTVSNCYFNGTLNGIHGKTNRTRGGIVQNLNYSNLVMVNVTNPILFDDYYFVKPHPPANEPAQAVTSNTPYWNSISISNVNALGATTPLQLWGLPEAPLNNITISGVTSIGTSSTTNVINHATGVSIINSTIVPAYSSYDAAITTITGGRPLRMPRRRPQRP